MTQKNDERINAGVSRQEDLSRFVNIFGTTLNISRWLISGQTRLMVDPCIHLPDTDCAIS